MKESVTYRLELARGFLREAEQDLTLARWRSSVSHAQLAVENSLKAVIGLFATLGFVWRRRCQRDIGCRAKNPGPGRTAH